VSIIPDYRKWYNHHMKKELKLVKEFHNKFKVPILKKPALIPKGRSDLRYELMREEVEEYAIGTKNKDLENIAKELADILYSTYGTILEHGLEDKMEKIFKEVHRSNMSKDYGKLKIKKGKNYFKPNLKKILDK
jgi:predicted HAD superfamily Cof-like phosphohydrolase